MLKVSCPMNHDYKVPGYKQYYSSEDQMDSQQRSFYRIWQENWNRGIALDVQGNISYLFCYTNKVLFLNCREAIPHLQKLIDSYTKEKYFVDYCKLWMSDCYVVLGDYRQAMEVFPPLDASSRGSTCTDELLSLRLQNDEHITGRDILTLNGPRVTAWGKAHLELVASYLEVILRAYEHHNAVNLLKSWKTHVDNRPYQVFRGAYPRNVDKLSCFLFSRDERVIKFICDMTRDAENSVREEMNIPRVGEGWISETELYYALIKAIPEAKVEHHARPSWLGRQHLDIFIPFYGVGIEYQGLQHDSPVEYFGGEEAYQKTKRRDIAKKCACAKNKVKLTEVRPGYNMKELLRVIRGMQSE
jgi:hypothetical protein